MSISIQGVGTVSPIMTETRPEGRAENMKKAAPVQGDTVNVPKSLDEKGAEDALAFIQNSISEQDANEGFGHSFDMERIARLLGD